MDPKTRHNTIAPISTCSDFVFLTRSVRLQTIRFRGVTKYRLRSISNDPISRRCEVSPLSTSYTGESSSKSSRSSAGGVLSPASLLRATARAAELEESGAAVLDDAATELDASIVPRRRFTWAKGIGPRFLGENAVTSSFGALLLNALMDFAQR